MLNKLISKAKDALIDLIKIEPFKQKENAPPLTAEQQFSLNLGSILTEHRHAYCNTLELGEEDLEEVKEGLEQAWEITDSDSAIHTLNWLLFEGHRALYPCVLHALKHCHDDDALTDYVVSITNDDEIRAKIYHFTNQLRESKKSLIEFDVISDQTDLNVDITAWDTGRCAAVARMCYEVNYLSEKEAWEFMKNAADISKPLYSSWKNFGDAYLIGRAMWSGPGMQLDNMLFTYKSLMTHENSPWIKFPWEK